MEYGLVRQFKSRGFYFFKGRINSIAFSPDGRWALSGSETTQGSDQNVRLWEVSSGKELYRLKSHRGGVTSVAFSPDGLYALSGGGCISKWDKTIYDTAIRLWDLRARKEIGRFGEDMFLVEAVAFTPDGRYALTGSRDKDRSACLRLWDIKTQKEVKRIGEHEFGVSSLSISPCGTRVLTGSGIPDVVPSPSFRSIKQWDIERGIEIPPPIEDRGWVRSISYTPDGLFALSLTALLDLRSGKVVRHYQSSSPFRSVHCSAISPDGQRILTGHGDQEEHFAPREDCTVRLFDFTTGEEICVFTGHQGIVISVAFSPDGTHALSGDEVGDIRLWRLPK